MREILFRGKRLDNGEWEYGSVVHQTDYYGNPVDRWFIIDGTDTQDYDIGFETEVDPYTVGQYTGLTDKNGKRIFEGDKFDKYNSVEYCNGGFCVNGDVPLSYWSRTHEVIGTVYDNPELIGGADNG